MSGKEKDTKVKTWPLYPGEPELVSVLQPSAMGTNLATVSSLHTIKATDKNGSCSNSCLILPVGFATVVYIHNPD